MSEEKSDSSPTEEQQSLVDKTENASAEAAGTDKSKVEILLKAAGNAPIMKKKKWAVGQDKTIGWIMDFIRRYLKLEAGDNLFLYLNQSFAPCPDQVIANLYECFGSDGNLVFHYSLTPAWG
ncbi:autophagy protein 12-like [Neocloeon triangulifer]|uniref:autophagy protein 12-like n=1 Tax=Neocloeon triangulifer TaxID=2078957 RepID=UPI00286EBD8C|nr:autophagy protein 12-like [Neocloeon triangulifer]